MRDMIPREIPRAALITGGEQGQGQAIARGLGDAGFAVAIQHGGDGTQAQAVAAELRACGVAAVALAADLRDEAALACMMTQAQTDIGPLGVLVNAAGCCRPDQWHDATPASWDAHLQINLRAPFALMQLFARALPAEAAGVIINLIDRRARSPSAQFLTHSVSTSGLWALTRSIALALAPRIRVNAIDPGRGTPPDEITRAMLMLLATPSVTGEMLALDGEARPGWHSRVRPATIET